MNTIEIPDWDTREKGLIIRQDANVFYRAMKDKLIKALPETANFLYRQTELLERLCWKRYERSPELYDKIELMLKFLYAEQYKEAQNVIVEVEDLLISNADIKSAFYKYWLSRKEKAGAAADENK